ncbi:hypothetical protein Leryth_019275 [Lithospermum erythrorhizon]|nr:hypothetical protein Leryth_019275 [Lithospermum erythrorhizon]
MDENFQSTNLLSFQKHSPNDHFRTTNFRATTFATNFSPDVASSSRYGSHVPPPAATLTLNTTHEIHFFRNTYPSMENHLMHQQTIPQICAHFSLPVDFSHNSKKRHQEIDSSNSDRRHKRMIKNRDAASRSRARKQESIFFFDNFSYNKT